MSKQITLSLGEDVYLFLPKETAESDKGGVMKFANEKEFADFMRGKHAKEHAQKSAVNAAILSPAPEAVNVKRRQPKGANKTEMAYRYRLEMEYPGCEIYFEGLTFRLKNNHKYTPDFVVRVGMNKVLCVEVKARGKNGYRQPSYQRARVMFDQCRVEWGNYQWRWAELCKGEWTVNDY